MSELTEERKLELASELEQSINRFIDKQWIISDHASCIAETEEEELFLNTVGYNFVVYV